MSNYTSIMPNFSIQQAGRASNPFVAANANPAAQNTPLNSSFQLTQLNRAQSNPGAPSLFNNSWLC